MLYVIFRNYKWKTMDDFLKWFSTIIGGGTLMGLVFVLFDDENYYTDPVLVRALAGFFIVVILFSLGKIWKLF